MAENSIKANPVRIQNSIRVRHGAIVRRREQLDQAHATAERVYKGRIQALSDEEADLVRECGQHGHPNVTTSDYQGQTLKTCNDCGFSWIGPR